MRRGRLGFLMRLLAMAVLTGMSQRPVTANNDPGQFIVRITPQEGTSLEYSLVLTGVAMEHRRTSTVITRSMTNDQTLGLLVQAEPGVEGLVEVFHLVGKQERATVSGRGRNVILRVVGGRSEVTGF